MAGEIAGDPGGYRPRPDDRRDCRRRNVRADIAVPVDAAKNWTIVSGHGKPCAHGMHRTRFRLRAKRNCNDLAGSFLIGL